MKNVYSIRDNLSAAPVMGAPFLAENDHQARRFLYCQVAPAALPTYSVFRIACFDEVTGQFENFEPIDITAAKKEVTNDAPSI